MNHQNAKKTQKKIPNLKRGEVPIKSKLGLSYRRKRYHQSNSTVEKLLEGEKRKNSKLEDIRKLKEMADLAELQSKPYTNSYKMKTKYVPLEQRYKKNLKKIRAQRDESSYYYSDSSEDPGEEGTESGITVSREDQERLVNELMRWQSQKELKISELRLEQLHQQTIFPHKPKILEKSKKIANKSRKGQPVHERLLDAGKSKLEKIENKKKMDRACMFKPKINDKSRKLARKDKKLRLNKGKITNLEFWDVYDQSKDEIPEAYPNPRRDLYRRHERRCTDWEGEDKDKLPGRKTNPVPWYKSPYGKHFREGIDDLKTMHGCLANRINPLLPKKKSKASLESKRSRSPKQPQRYRMDEFQPLSASKAFSTANLLSKKKSRSILQKKDMNKSREPSLERRRRLFNDKAVTRNIGNANDNNRKNKIKNLLYKDYKKSKINDGERDQENSQEYLDGIRTGRLGGELVNSTEIKNRHKKEFGTRKDDGNKYLYENILLNKKNINSPERLKANIFLGEEIKRDPFVVNWSNSYKKDIESMERIKHDYAGRPVKTCDEYFEEMIKKV